MGRISPVSQMQFFILPLLFIDMARTAYSLLSSSGFTTRFGVLEISRRKRKEIGDGKAERESELGKNGGQVERGRNEQAMVAFEN